MELQYLLERLFQKVSNNTIIHLCNKAPWQSQRNDPKSFINCFFNRLSLARINQACKTAFLADDDFVIFYYSAAICFKLSVSPYFFNSLILQAPKSQRYQV